MANELFRNYQGVANLYAVIRRISDGTVWTGTAFVAYVDADVANYDVALTSQGGDLYAANFPSTIAAGTYLPFYYKRIGATPAITDTLLGIDEPFYWSGAAVIVAPGAHWTTRAGMESEGGTLNIQTYANLENGDVTNAGVLADIEAEIEDSLSYADNIINSKALLTGVTLPMAGQNATTTTKLDYIARKLAVPHLYRKRGQDQTDENNDRMSEKERWAMNQLALLVVNHFGGATRTYNTATAPVTVDIEDAIALLT